MMDVLRGMRRHYLMLNGSRLKIEETLPWYHLASSLHEVEHLLRLCNMLIELAEEVDHVTE
jgi:hypothetical protein